MNWLVLTILAIISRATYSIATKLQSKNIKISSVSLAFLLTAFAAFLTLPLSPFIGGISLNGIEKHWVSMILIILTQVFGNILFFKGVKRLDAGTAQIAFSSIIIWGVMLSIAFLNSHFSITQLFGIFLLLAAIIMIQYQERRLKLNIGVIYIIISAAFFAVFQVASAAVARAVSPATYLSLTYFGAAVLFCLIYPKVIKKDLISLKKAVKLTFINTLFASIASLLYFVFAYFAYQRAPDRGIVVILLTSQVILSVIFGMIFLKERDHILRKLVASILAFIAGALIQS